MKRFLTYIISAALLLGSCTQFDLPEAGSVVDKTPPAAAFSVDDSPTQDLKYLFTNTSVSAVSYAWDFGDGEKSTEKNPTHTFPAEGTYVITLTATDGNGVTSTFKKEDFKVVKVTFLIPKFINPRFIEASGSIVQAGGENGAGMIDGYSLSEDEVGKHWWAWKAGFPGTSIPQNSSTVGADADGTKTNVCKLPVFGGNTGTTQRVAYQGVEVEPLTDYTISFDYSMKDEPADGIVKMRVLNKDIADLSEAVGDALIVDKNFTDKSGSSNFARGTFTFSSGAFSKFWLLITNTNNEARIDNLSIERVGLTDPNKAVLVASFAVVPDTDNKFKFSFPNASKEADSYSWEFGDGTTSTDKDPSHTYAKTGDYTVVLTATQGSGDDAKSETFQASISIANPVANFTALRDETNRRLYTFSNSSTGASSYKWFFGDDANTMSEENAPSFTYENDGEYTITLIAVDFAGNISTTTSKITVVGEFKPEIFNGNFRFAVGPEADSFNNPDKMYWAWDNAGGKTVGNSGDSSDSGTRAAKFDRNDGRVARQDIIVEANKNYKIKFKYSMKTDAADAGGEFKAYVSSSDAEFSRTGTDKVDALSVPTWDAASVLAEGSYTEQMGSKSYIEKELTFASGTNTTVYLVFTNTNSECRVDEVSIEEVK